ncbi:MAG: hypothetical protein ACU836_02485 [Gammaproteobacteria bacterium]
MGELNPIPPSSVVHNVRKIEPEQRRKPREEQQQDKDTDVQKQPSQDNGPAQHIDEIV